MVSSKRASESVRLLRVGETIRHALSEILGRGPIADPDLAGLSVTVSAVEVSPDLRHADVYVAPLLDERAEEAVAALNRHAALLQGALSGEIRLKYLPRLTFKHDTRFAEADRIESLLNSAAVRRDLDKDEDD